MSNRLRAKRTFNYHFYLHLIAKCTYIQAYIHPCISMYKDKKKHMYLSNDKLCFQRERSENMAANVTTASKTIYSCRSSDTAEWQTNSANKLKQKCLLFLLRRRALTCLTSCDIHLCCTFRRSQNKERPEIVRTRVCCVAQQKIYGRSEEFPQYPHTHTHIHT